MISTAKGGELKAACDGDGCAVTAYGGVRPEGDRAEQFRGFVAELKQLGWRVRKEGQDWAHYCPGCAEE